MNREQIGKFLILRELQHKENVGKLNEKGKDVLLMLQFDEDNLNNKDMKEVLEFIDNLEANQNQKAIECLKEVKDNFCSARMIFFADCELSQKEKDLILDHQEEDKRILVDLIDNKIKELEGNNDKAR